MTWLIFTIGILFLLGVIVLAIFSSENRPDSICTCECCRLAEEEEANTVPPPAVLYLGRPMPWNLPPYPKVSTKPKKQDRHNLN